MKHLVFKRNFWTGETLKIAEFPSSFSACEYCDRYNMDRNRADYGETYYYFEPVGGWTVAGRKVKEVSPA